MSMSMAIDVTLFHVVFTVVLMVIFVGIVVWAYSAKRKKDFEQAARLPFDNNNDNDNEGNDNRERNREDRR